MALGKDGCNVTELSMDLEGLHIDQTHEVFDGMATPLRIRTLRLWCYNGSEACFYACRRGVLRNVVLPNFGAQAPVWSLALIHAAFITQLGIPIGCPLYDDDLGAIVRPFVNLERLVVGGWISREVENDPQGAGGVSRILNHLPLTHPWT